MYSNSYSTIDTNNRIPCYTEPTCIYTTTAHEADCSTELPEDFPYAEEEEEDKGPPFYRCLFKDNIYDDVIALRRIIDFNRVIIRRKIIGSDLRGIRNFRKIA